MCCFHNERFELNDRKLWNNLPNLKKSEKNDSTILAHNSFVQLLWQFDVMTAFWRIKCVNSSSSRSQTSTVLPNMTLTHPESLVCLWVFYCDSSPWDAGVNAIPASTRNTWKHSVSPSTPKRNQKHTNQDAEKWDCLSDEEKINVNLNKWGFLSGNIWELKIPSVLEEMLHRTAKTRSIIKTLDSFQLLGHKGCFEKWSCFVFQIQNLWLI